jgi:hypothetical protein
MLKDAEAASGNKTWTAGYRNPGGSATLPTRVGVLRRPRINTCYEIRLESDLTSNKILKFLTQVPASIQP